MKDILKALAVITKNSAPSAEPTQKQVDNKTLNEGVKSAPRGTASRFKAGQSAVKNMKAATKEKEEAAKKETEKKTVSEETKATKTGRIHKGSYGTSYDGDEKKSADVKRGRGRPKKGSDESGEVKKYDFSAFLKKVDAPKTASGRKHKMVS